MQITKSKRKQNENAWIPTTQSNLETVNKFPAKVSDETVDFLKELLAIAKSGKLIGLSIVTLYHDGKYSLNLRGEARIEGNQMSVAGMLAGLQKIVLENH
jgi:hypothetical protein